MRPFGLISDIRVNDPGTWENKIFITTDIDWACDGVIEYCDDFFSQFKCKVTWFVTHETPLIDTLRKNKNYELGIRSRSLTPDAPRLHAKARSADA